MSLFYRTTIGIACIFYSFQYSVTFGKHALDKLSITLGVDIESNFRLQKYLIFTKDNYRASQ